MTARKANPPVSTQPVHLYGSEASANTSAGGSVSLPSAAEILRSPRFEGERIPFSQLVGKSIVVKDYIVLHSQYREGRQYVLMQVEVDGKPYTTTTGSDVVRKQLEVLRPHLPVRAVPRRVNRYFTLA